jgi:hypothetical protein
MLQAATYNKKLQTNKQTGSEDTEEKRAGLFEKIGS